MISLYDDIAGNHLNIIKDLKIELIFNIPLTLLLSLKGEGITRRDFLGNNLDSLPHEGGGLG
ncbi:MAG: hypothetical protein HZB33_06845 [Nitrospirae bacterium]|nr:hypothetical protein [Nitrospirota bacterium]